MSDDEHEHHECGSGALVPPPSAMAKVPEKATSVGELLNTLLRLQGRRREAYGMLEDALDSVLLPLGDPERTSGTSYMRVVGEVTSLFAVLSNAVRNIEAKFRGSGDEELADADLADLVRRIQQVERDKLVIVSAVHALKVQIEDRARHETTAQDGVIVDLAAMEARLHEQSTVLGSILTDHADLMQELQIELQDRS